ncbi:Dickkopf N-terminal cysteine-rich domain-containing protein [Lentzea cavernae]|uniref:Uncharacterized protein n=1 Tax=Lentzea cavernae TaxID=2020703 RepID=A0ABQ3MSZ9_9PSEU|nr:Dickkopf N-terminal cysteine-rich domain-containing protein [Lentzea cavernae]GHH61288.1 hypothetical protein GCM10017774_87020 [Lentzea cavernae]
MTGTAVAARLATGHLQQHLNNEPTAVAENCVQVGLPCHYDDDCCPGLVCTWWSCVYAT